MWRDRQFAIKQRKEDKKKDLEELRSSSRKITIFSNFAKRKLWLLFYFFFRIKDMMKYLDRNANSDKAEPTESPEKIK